MLEGNSFFSITINSTQDVDYFNFKNQEIKLGFEYDLVNHISKRFPTISFIWFVYEKNKKGKYHMHAVLCIRNFIDYSYILCNNIKELLINSLRFTQISCNINNNGNSEDSDDDFLIFSNDFNNYNYNFDFDVKVESLKYYKDINN